MFRERNEEIISEQDIMRGRSRRNQWLYVGLVLTMATLIVVTPAIQSWISVSQQPSSYSVIFVFSSENLLWHSGQLVVTYEDGYEETQSLFGTVEKYGDDESYLGFETYVRASRNFTQSESWSIEYFCSGLNMTVGPILFVTDYPQVLYSDVLGRVIEIWFGENR